MSDSPGWDSLDGALKIFYPDQESVHFGTVIKYDLGGPDPLDGISIYDHDDHWHYVSFGYSELYAKESELPQQSGSAAATMFGWGLVLAGAYGGAKLGAGLGSGRLLGKELGEDEIPRNMLARPEVLLRQIQLAREAENEGVTTPAVPDAKQKPSPSEAEIPRVYEN